MFKYDTHVVLCPEQHGTHSCDDIHTTMYTQLQIGSGAVISGCPRIYITAIDERDDVASTPFTHEEIKSAIAIGDDCFMDSSHRAAFPNTPVKLTCNRLAGGVLGRIEIGHNCTLQGTAICSYERITIGNNVMFGPNVVVMDSSGHALTARGQVGEAQRISVKPVHIADDVWVGYGCIILPGVRIGQGAVIGAGSVVTKDIPPMVMAAGNPCRVIKPL